MSGEPSEYRGLVVVADAEAEPDAATCWSALGILLHGFAPEQRTHAARFLLDDLERGYIAGGRSPPVWINTLRAQLQRGG